jgi:hypothetical protein
MISLNWILYNAVMCYFFLYKFDWKWHTIYDQIMYYFFRLLFNNCLHLNFKAHHWHCLHIYQGLKLRKYFRGQMGPHQINFGSPHNLLGAHQARIARLTPRLQGTLQWGGPLKAPGSPGSKIGHSETII